MNNVQDKIYRVSKQTGLPVKKVYDLLFLLKEGKKIENNTLVRIIGVSRSVANRVKQLFSDLLEPSSKNTMLRKKSAKRVQKLFGKEYQTEENLWKFLENVQYSQVVELLKKYQRLRPSPDRKYDQFTATIETTAKRASLLNFFADVEGKRLTLIGDDDFTSVALALNNKPAKITVFEIDKRIINAIEEISQKENLKIEVVEYDARKRIPRDYKGKYDMAFMDPPYTTGGISLFLSRCIDLLDLGNQSARIYLCYGNSDRAKERFLPIQKIFTDSGLMIRWVFDKFNRYVGAESIGSTSTLYVADITPRTGPTIQGEFNEKIYTI